MNTAITINLDYDAQPSVKCRQLWTLIEERMTQAGFVKVSRRFVTEMDLDTACTAARKVIDTIELEYCAVGQSAMSYIRDFYAIPCDRIVNLSEPMADAIEVEVMSIGAFQKFFGN